MTSPIKMPVGFKYRDGELHIMKALPITLKPKRATKRKRTVLFKHAWQAVGGPQYVEEYRGIPGRNFRFDYAWPEKRAALEIDGGVWMKKGGHTTGAGKTRDCTKDWLAAQHGWRVIRWTTAMVNVRNCEILAAILLGEQVKAAALNTFANAMNR